jgi:hypothetical protein
MVPNTLLLFLWIWYHEILPRKFWRWSLELGVDRKEYFVHNWNIFYGMTHLPRWGEYLLSIFLFLPSYNIHLNYSLEVGHITIKEYNQTQRQTHKCLQKALCAMVFTDPKLCKSGIFMQWSINHTFLEGCDDCMIDWPPGFWSSCNIKRTEEIKSW